MDSISVPAIYTVVRSVLVAISVRKSININGFLYICSTFCFSVYAGSVTWRWLPRLS